jgi:hypothetical protein
MGTFYKITDLQLFKVSKAGKTKEVIQIERHNATKCKM